MTKALFKVVEESILDVLETRRQKFSVLIHGWQKKPTRMVAAKNAISEQTHLPVLFRPQSQSELAVTHVGMCGWIEHKEDIEFDRRLMSWLGDRRVERFADIAHSDDVETLYVVSGTIRVTEACPPMDRIMFKNLDKADKSGRLAPNFQRGYAMVELPGYLFDWFKRGRSDWETIASTIPDAAENQL